MKALDCKVRWMEGWENDPELEILVDRLPELSELRYECKEGLYYAELDGYVDFIYKQNPSVPDEGFGGRGRSLTMTDGTVVSFRGGWSSRAGVSNMLGFKECMDVTITDNPEGWDRGHHLYAGSVTHEFAKKAVEDFLPDIWLEKVVKGSSTPTLSGQQARVMNPAKENNEYIYVPHRTENPCKKCKGIREYKSPFEGKIEKCDRCLETGHHLFESKLHHRTNHDNLKYPFLEVDEKLKWHFSGFPPKEFKHVATILSNDLEIIYLLTQHIEESWWDSNNEVIIQKDGSVHFVYLNEEPLQGFRRKAKDLIQLNKSSYHEEEEPKYRSTSIGDVIILEDGTVWQCAALGWDPVPITNKLSQNLFEVFRL